MSGGRSEPSESMEVGETERVVIAKPVASRPNCSRLKSFSEFLTGDIDYPCSTSTSEQVVAAIRPKTIRFRPLVNQITGPAASSQVSRFASLHAGIPRTVTCDLATEEDSMSRGETTVIYKPKAKFATRSPMSLSVNQGSFHSSHSPVSSSQAEAALHDFATNVQTSIPRVETYKTSEPSKSAPRCLVEEDNRSSHTASNADGTFYDGYNWRKYGQKQVKGSEYPRSYYKCTHPKCPVKKKVERSFDGQITEIVYNGEHSHAKPQPCRPGSGGTHQVLETVPDDSACRRSNNHLGGNCIGEGSECRLENHDKVGSSTLSTYHGEGQLGCEHHSSCGPSGSFDGRTMGMKMEDERPRNKRRKSESQSKEAGISGEATQQDGNVVVQSSSNTDPLGDGFRWRKYGQKVVKGSPYPRSYYRCTSLKCNVRKHVERATDDPTSFVTTYEGKHNHKMPTRGGNPSTDHRETMRLR